MLFSLMDLCRRLKTVEMVIRNTQGAEGVLKQYEDCLREVHSVPRDIKQVETYRTKLKVSTVSTSDWVWLRFLFLPESFFCLKSAENAS